MAGWTEKWFIVSTVIVFAVGTAALGCGDGQSEDVANAPSQQPAFEPIFNGTDLSGWDGDSRFWRAEGGSLVGQTTEETPTEANTFVVWQGGEPDDFELRYRIRFVSESGNSGVQIRSDRFTDAENPNLNHRVRGYQVDFAISDWIPGIVYDEGGRGVLARRGQRVLFDREGERHEERFAEEEELAQHIRLDDWNQYHVVVRGDTIRSRINGETMHEVIDESPDAEHEGIIAIQLHTGPPMQVELSEIELLDLEPGMSPTF